MASLLLVSFTLTVVVLVLFLYRYLSLGSNPLPFPPGPPPEPLIGNLRQIPRTTAWKTYAEWTRKYNSFGKRVVVINSAQAAVDLLEKRGAIYSERDRNTMLQDLIGFKNVVFMSYDETCRLHRKVLNSALNSTAARDYHPIQERETYATMDRLLNSPDQWSSHLRRAANSTVLTITYGHQVITDNDYLVTLSERALKVIRQSAPPNAFLVNMFPALRHIPDWVPGIGFMEYARAGRKLFSDVQEIPFKKVLDQIDAGIVVPSYTRRLLETKGTITGNPDSDEELIKATAMIMYGAGSDTSTTALINIILDLILHPDVQRKVQAEIDAVVGNNRLPSFSDQGSLPYLEMVIAESLRWNPTSAMGIPHALKQDDYYKGMFIPKGSVIMSNIWSIMHDEEVYPDPYRFWPERFDGRFPNTRHPQNFAFGFNRRLCPGRHVALNSLFIQAANLLAVFNFSKPHDEHGNEIAPVVDYSEGPPKPFNCTITARSDAAIALIRSAAATIVA